MEKVAFSLGSNQGDRLSALRLAVDGLGSYIEIDEVSSVFETTPVYITDQPLFANLAVIGRTKLTALALLWNVKQLETELGRTPTFRYGPRLIDIDLLLLGEQMITSDELTVPHSHMHERAFVLRPLAQIAASWVHPRLKHSVGDLLAELPDEAMKDLGPLP